MSGVDRLTASLEWAHDEGFVGRTGKPLCSTPCGIKGMGTGLQWQCGRCLDCAQRLTASMELCIARQFARHATIECSTPCGISGRRHSSIRWG